MPAAPDPHRWTADEQRWSAWMARAQRGDQDAYRALLTELGRASDAYIRVRFGALDVLEDCVQECLLAVHRARHTWDPARLFRAWFFTLVRHRTIDVLRASVDTSPAQGPSWLEAGSDPIDLQRRLDGVKVLQGLAPDHREAITLTQYAGCTSAEAAAWLGISESALKARVRRGLAAIRAILDAEGTPT